MSFLNKTDPEKAMECSSVMRYLGSDPNDKSTYTIARFCPIHQLSPLMQGEFINLVTIVIKNSTGISQSSIRFVVQPDQSEDPLQLQEVILFNNNVLFINLDKFYVIDFNSQQGKTNVTYLSRFTGRQTFARCFSIFTSYLTCYIEVDAQHSTIETSKYLLEFTTSSSDIFYKLPPIRLNVEQGAKLETVFNNFLVFRSEDSSKYQLINRETYTKVFEYQIPESNSLVLLEASALAPMPITSSLDLGVLAIIDQNQKILTISLINLFYPFFEIQVGQLGQGSSCLNYLTNCGEILFTLTNPIHTSTQHKYTFYHVSTNFNAILPNFNGSKLTYPFVGGAIDLKVSDLFYGITYQGKLHFQSGLPTLKNLEMQSQSNEKLFALSDTSIGILKNNINELSQLNIFYSLDVDKNLMLSIVSKFSPALTGYSILREPVNFEKQGFVLTESSFSENKFLTE